MIGKEWQSRIQEEGLNLLEIILRAYLNPNLICIYLLLLKGNRAAVMVVCVVNTMEVMEADRPFL